MANARAACFDSDIVIDFLQGRPQAAETFGQYVEGHISIVTWIEVMTGAARGGVEGQVRTALGQLQIHDATAPIAEIAVELRVARRLRTPDAVIWATARALGVPLLTRNTRDFPETDGTIRVPYRL